MTRRAKIVVGVVMSSAVVLAGSAIAQATSPHTSKEQRVKAAHPASALHRQVRAAMSAKVKESRPDATHAQAQTAPQDSLVETEKPETVGTETVDDNSPEAKDDDPAIENKQADDDEGEQSDDDQGEQEDDDDQGEQEDTSAGDQDDDSSQADVEDDDDSSGQTEDDGHEDEDAGDD